LKNKSLLKILVTVFLLTLIPQESVLASSNFTVSAITISPLEVNLVNGPVTVTASINIVSTNPVDLTRLPLPYFQMGLSNPIFEKWELSSGTATNGTYSTQITIFPNMGSSAWTFGSKGFYDTTGVQSSALGYVAQFKVESGVILDPLLDPWNSELKLMDDLVSQSNSLLADPAVKKIKSQGPFNALRQDIVLAQQEHQLVAASSALPNLNKFMVSFTKDYGRAKGLLKQKSVKKK
jgi:hypothetical protein